MGKLITINASYKHKHHIFTVCNPQEFLVEAAEHYDIDMNEHELFLSSRGKLCKIKPHELAQRDLIMIKIVPINALSNSHSTLRSCSAEKPKEKDESCNIIYKLTNNNLLTVAEREYLIECVEDSVDDASLPKKRKKDSVNKDVQVNSSVLQHSFTQTDAVEIKDCTDEPLTLKTNCAKSKKSEAQRMMQDTFADRRHFILLKHPSVQEVYDKYPTLFSLDELKNELDRIFYPGKCACFIENMKKYSEHILEACSPDDESYRRTQKNIKSAPSECQKTYARVVGSIFVLGKLVDEDCQFIHFKDSPSGNEDIYPYIDAPCSVKEIFVDNFTFNVIVENQKLCEAPNFLEAILCLMASFFIFHIDYPKNCCQTLTVIEKLCLKSYLWPEDAKIISEQTSQMIKMLQLK